MAGRRPKPTALKELTGNPGKRRLNENEPQPTGIPECPPHLSAVAREEWARVAPTLIACGLLTDADRAEFAGYCSNYALARESDENIAQYGAVVKAPSGYPIQNPYIAIRRQALEQMHKFAVEFGMTPASRGKVSSVEGPNFNKGGRRSAQSEDPADKYFTAPSVSAGSKRVQ